MHKPCATPGRRAWRRETLRKRFETETPRRVIFGFGGFLASRPPKREAKIFSEEDMEEDMREEAARAGAGST